MKIGYVKLAKKSKRIHKDWVKNILILLKCMFNCVEQDKYKKELYTVYNFNEKSMKKLITKMQADEVDYALAENGYQIDFPGIKSKYSIIAMLPELIDKCYELIKPRLDEVYICTNIFCEDNIKIIREIIPKIKTVNIVTNNRKYHALERSLEEQGIFVTVTNNKRKSLKNASIVVNLDFHEFNDYNINRYMILIDTTENVCIQNGFEGIIISKLKISTKKIHRVFSEYSEFDKNQLIEAEIAKLEDYDKVRDFIRLNKIKIELLYNKNVIDLKEFSRIKKINNEMFLKKKK